MDREFGCPGLFVSCEGQEVHPFANDRRWHLHVASDWTGDVADRDWPVVQENVRLQLNRRTEFESQGVPIPGIERKKNRRAASSAALTARGCPLGAAPSGTKVRLGLEIWSEQ